jgi:hypothetical protein
LIYSRDQYGDDFEHLLYTYIESGFPILTTVDGHVFVSMGHTSDFSGVPPMSAGAAFRYTSCFNRALSICDDNQFPYQTLKEARADAVHPCSEYAFEDIQEFIVPLPEKVFLPAESVQEAIENVLGSPVTGISALSPSLRGEDITLRLFLTTGRSFKARLRERGMGHGLVSSMYRQIPLPHFIWVCEISVTSEYISDLKVRGEIIWDATRNAHEPNGWLALHYPEKLIVDVGSVLNRRQELQNFGLPSHQAYPLFRSNLNPLCA